MPARKVIAAFVTLLLISVPSVGMQQATLKPPPNSRRSKTTKSPSDRLQILQHHLPKLADSALSLKDLELKVETLGRMGDLMWNVDADRGRQLFQRTYDLLRVIEPANEQWQAKPDDASEKLPQGKLISLYVRFFSLVGKRDAAWREQLLRDAPEFLNTPSVARNVDLNTANLLLEAKDAKAYDFIDAGVSNGVDGLSHTIQILDLLRRLRELDPGKADQLFLQMMRQMESQREVPADTLLTIGNHLFTGRPSGPTPEDKVLISPVFVGKIAFHADISYDRPGISPETAERYLRSSVAILTRAFSDETTAMQNSAAAFLLLPKARRFAPDLVPLLSNLSVGIDPRRTNSAEARSTPPESTGPITIDSVSDALAAMKDPVKRDEYCLRMIGFFYATADFKSATTLVDRMSSSEIREQLASLIPIGQAINSLKKGDLDVARLQTRRLSPGKDRSFIWFAIATRMIEKGDEQGARIALDSGVADARKAEGSNKSYLLLLGSELTSTIDPAAGSNILFEALHVINSFESDLNEPLRFDRFLRVRTGSQSVTFSTDVSGCKIGTVQGALKGPVSRDPHGTLTLVLQLKNEYIRSSALLAFVSALIS